MEETKPVSAEQPNQIHFNKSDIVGSVIIGEAVAWLLFIMAKVNAPELPIPSGLATSLTSLMGGVAMAIALPILCVAGLFVAYKVSKIIKIAYQAAKFILVGALNTFVDLGILNALIFATGVTSGSRVSMFKAISFVVAVINSYYWNKRWTFESKQEKGGKEFTQFMFVSVIGFFLNVGTTYVFVSIIGPQFGLAPAPWANVGALAGTFLVLLWNFVGYKFWVFKK